MGKEKPDGYWNNKVNVLKEIQIVMKEKKLNRMPTQTELKEIGKIRSNARVWFRETSQPTLFEHYWKV